MLRLATVKHITAGAMRSLGRIAPSGHVLPSASRHSTTAALALLLVAAIALPASAVPISSFGGAWGGVEQPTGTSIVFTDGFAISPGSPGSSLAGGSIDDLTITTTGFTGTVNGAGGLVNVGQLRVTTGAGVAVFDLTNELLTSLEFTLPSGPFGVGSIIASATLNALQTTPALLPDLAPFAAPGASLVITYNSMTVNNGGTVELGPSPTGSFTMIAIPEPSSVILGLSGVVCLALSSVSRRRRKAGNRNVAAENIG